MITSGGTTTLGLYDNASAISKKADIEYVDNEVNVVLQELNIHIEDSTNPHQVTKDQVGLGNVDNTADLDKPVSNSTQAAIISAVAPKAETVYVDNALSNLSTAANKFYPTLAEANADIANIAVNQPVSIGEIVNGGLWYKDIAGATTLTKSPYDPLTQSKSYADQTKAPLENFNTTGNPDHLHELRDSLNRIVAAWNLEAEYVGKLLTDGIIRSVEQPDGSNVLSLGDGIEVDIYGAKFTLDFSNPDVAFQILSSDNKTFLSVPIGGADLENMNEIDGILSRLNNLTKTIRTDGLPENEFFGENFTIESKNKLARLRAGESVQWVISSIGNSWADADIYFTRNFVRCLKAKYGNAGAGFGAPVRGFSDLEEASIVLNGTWTTTNGATANGVNAEGLALIKATSSEVGAYAQVQLGTRSSTATKLKLYAKANGAVVSFQSNDGATTQITLNSTVTELTVDLDSSRGQTQYGRFTVVSGDFVFFGIELQNSNKGVRFNKCGASSSTWLRWLATEQNQWVEQFTALNSDTILMLEGVNGSYSYDAETEALYTSQMLDRVRLASPITDVLLISPPDTLATNRSHSLYDYAYRMRQLAYDKSIAHIDLTKTYGSSANANAHNLWSDTNHPNTKGGAVISATLQKFLTI